MLKGQVSQHPPLATENSKSECVCLRFRLANDAGYNASVDQSIVAANCGFMRLRRQLCQQFRDPRIARRARLFAGRSRFEAFLAIKFE